MWNNISFPIYYHDSFFHMYFSVPSYWGCVFMEMIFFFLLLAWECACLLVFWCRSTFSCIDFYNCVSSFCWKRTICPSMLAKVTGLVCNSFKKKKKMLLRSVSRCLVWTLMGLSISLGDKLCNNLRLLFIFTQEWYSKNVKISRYPVHW